MLWPFKRAPAVESDPLFPGDPVWFAFDGELAPGIVVDVVSYGYVVRSNMHSNIWLIRFSCVSEYKLCRRTVTP